MSETTGRCRSEMTAAYESKSFKPNDSDVVIADAIDRLAADVAAIRAKVDAISDVAHLLESDEAWVKLVEDQRDAAIRERDQWREEARLAVINRDEARAEVERLKNELYDREQEILSLRADTVERQQPPVAPQPAGQSISPKVADTQPTGNAAPAAGWLRDDERDVLEELAFRIERWVNADKYDADGKRLAALRSILARAGSPPVVVLPTVFARSLLGDELVALQQVKDAMNKAGVKWKEVGRE